MGTLIRYQPNQWLAMLNLKSSLAYMKKNNADGIRDSAIEKQTAAFKYFLTSVPEREEAAAAA